MSRHQYRSDSLPARLTGKALGGAARAGAVVPGMFLWRAGEFRRVDEVERPDRHTVRIKVAGEPAFNIADHREVSIAVHRETAGGKSRLVGAPARRNFANRTWESAPEMHMFGLG